MASSQKLSCMQKKMVVIYGDKYSTYGIGHGVLISPDGLILTAFHLFDKKPIGSRVAVKCDYGEGAKMISAKILKLEAKLDLAMLKIEATDCEYARVAPEVRIGQDVDIIVSRDGVSFSYTRGIVAFERRPRTGFCCPKLIKFISEETIFVQVHGLHGMPGHSGSPIFDSRCRIVGIYSNGCVRMDMLVHREHLKTFCEPFIQVEEEDGEEEEVEVQMERKKKKKDKNKKREVKEEELKKKKKEVEQTKKRKRKAEDIDQSETSEAREKKKKKNEELS